jgi:hypothetical protein
LTDVKCLPLALVITGANTHDVKLLAATLDAIVIARPDTAIHKQNLCLDAGYVGEPDMKLRKGASSMSGRAAKRLQEKKRPLISSQALGG